MDNLKIIWTINRLSGQIEFLADNTFMHKKLRDEY